MRNDKDNKMKDLTDKGLEVGDIYLDCSYHPVLCTESVGDDVSGISLFDGSTPRQCSIYNCSPIKLMPEQVKFFIEKRNDFLEAESLFKKEEKIDVYDKFFEEIEKLNLFKNN